MKTILTILLIFVYFGLQAQTHEKWIDTDSLNAAKAEIDNANIGLLTVIKYDTDTVNTDYLQLKNSEPVDNIINLDYVIHNDTLYFPFINLIIKYDSSYATDKNWNWIYNLGKP